MRKVVLLATALLASALSILCFCDLVPHRPARNCPIDALLLDTTPFPEGAVADEAMVPAPEGPPESALIDIGWSDGYAMHEVHRIRSARVAARRFERGEVLFATGAEEPPWQIASGLDYSSPIADRYRVACRRRDADVSVCIMIGQYEEYYVQLIVDVAPDEVQVLEQLLRAIDQRMGSCLNKALTPTKGR
jgi:hypothetical protein